MAITPEQAYRPVLGEKPSEMDDNGLVISEFQLRTRSNRDPKNEEISKALTMITGEMEKRKLKPFGSK